MAKGPEAKVKDKIVNILKFHDAWYCFPATRGMGRSGVPDILVCHRGTFIAIEVKRDEKHKPTKLQEHELWKVQQCGGWACIIHAGNLLDLEGLMSTITAAAEIRKLQNEDDLVVQEQAAKQTVDGQPNCPWCTDTGIQADGSKCDHPPAPTRHEPKEEDAIN